MIFFKKKDVGKEEVEKIKEETKDFPKVEETKIEKEEYSIPLFVKIERYEEILSVLNELKVLIRDVSNAISMLNEIEKMRNENLAVIQRSFEKLKEKIEYFDSKFKKPRILKENIPKQEISSIEESLNKLKSELEKMKFEERPKI